MRSIVSVAGVAVGVVLALAAPASAVVIPASAVPASAAGDTVDCQVTALPMTVTGVDLNADVRVTCSTGADIHRAKSAPSFYEVMANGSLRQLVAPGGFGLMSSTDPILTSGSGVELDCGRGSGLSGTHTYLFRARVVVKRTTTHNSAPFIAKVARKQVVTCP